MTRLTMVSLISEPRERGATRHLRIRALGATGRVAEAASYKHELTAHRIDRPARTSCSRCLCPGWSHHTRRSSIPPDFGTGIIIPVTNIIEALNAKLRRAVRTRGHFPSDDAALKLLFLVLNLAEREWRMPPREWSLAKAQFAILFDDRFQNA